MHTSTFVLNESGRDFVVGDVHGCFRTLERALIAITFDPNLDRLFGVGDLVNRGPHSEEALGWLEQRFEAVVLGNHDRSVLSWFRAKPAKLRSRPPAESKWLLGLSSREHRSWRAALGSMPLAITIETAYGPVGVVHAEAPHHSWAESLRRLETASPSVVDDVVLGFASPRKAVATGAARWRGCVRSCTGMSPWSMSSASPTAGTSTPGRAFRTSTVLSLVEVNTPEFRTRTFDIDESS